MKYLGKILSRFFHERVNEDRSSNRDFSKSLMQKLFQKIHLEFEIPDFCLVLFQHRINFSILFYIVTAHLLVRNLDYVMVEMPISQRHL